MKITLTNEEAEVYQSLLLRAQTGDTKLPTLVDILDKYDKAVLAKDRAVEQLDKTIEDNRKKLKTMATVYQEDREFKLDLMRGMHKQFDYYGISCELTSMKEVFKALPRVLRNDIDMKLCTDITTSSLIADKLRQIRDESLATVEAERTAFDKYKRKTLHKLASTKLALIRSNWLTRLFVRVQDE